MDEVTQHALKKIRGLLSHGAGLILQEHAAQVQPPDSIVEVGSYTGKSTCYLATAMQPGVRMFAVDAWDTLQEMGWAEDERHGYSDPDTYAEFRDNLVRFGVASKVRVTRADSRVAARRLRNSVRPIGLFWLDGDHRVAGVRADLNAWVPLMNDETIVLFDDYYYGGVSSSLADVEHELLYKKRVARSTGKALKEAGYGISVR